MSGAIRVTFLVLSAGLSLCGCQMGESKREKVEQREKGTGMDVVQKPWPVWATAFSPDGRWLAAGRGYRSNTKGWLGGKGEVNVWKVEDWKLQDGFSAPFTTYVEVLSFTSDSQHLFAAATQYIQLDPKTGASVHGTPNPFDGNVVFVWMVLNGSLEQTYHFNNSRGTTSRSAGAVSLLDVHPGGEFVRLSHAGCASMIQQRKTDRPVYNVGNNGFWRNLAFSPDGKTLALTRRSSVQLCDADTGKERFHRDFKGEEPICLCFCGSSKQIAVGMKDGSVHLLTADLTKQLHSLEVSPDKEWVVAVASAPTTDLLAAVTTSRVRLFEATSGKQLHEWGKEDLIAFAIALSPDGKLLAVGYGGKHNVKGERRGGFVKIWDTSTGQLVKKLD